MKLLVFLATLYIVRNVDAFTTAVKTRKSPFQQWKNNGNVKTQDVDAVSIEYVDQLTDKTSSLTTEVNRVKLKLNDVRSELKASEEKTVAAEVRVALLEDRLQDIEVEKRGIEQTWKARLLKETNSLKYIITTYVNSREKFKFESRQEKKSMKKKHDEETEEMEEKLNLVRSNLEKAKSELMDAKQETVDLSADFTSVRENMTNQLASVKSDSEKNLEQTHKKYDDQINEIKSSSDMKKASYVNENKIVQDALSREKGLNSDLNRDLNLVRSDMTKQLIASKESSAREVSGLQIKMDDKLEIERNRRELIEEEKKNIIRAKDALEDEKQSLRTLAKISASLVKKRIVKLATKVSRKANKVESKL
mmetsp:Transcript_18311/g.22416  ORF Transcript_18311/g.22416 Transcript_18311/m.22416 type:complete len:364 (-) Transcript_18311:107-1198(-)